MVVEGLPFPGAELSALQPQSSPLWVRAQSPLLQASSSEAHEVMSVDSCMEGQAFQPPPLSRFPQAEEEGRVSPLPHRQPRYVE